MVESHSALVGVVDDDEAIRESLRLLLFSADIPCQVFASADEFLAHQRELAQNGLARNERALSCLLLDIRMPGTDGLELFRILRRDKAPFPIIFITGHGDIPLAVSAIKQGAFDFLTKPFKQGELLEKVKAALAHQAASAAELQSLFRLRRRADTCTPREQDVMELMVRGLPNKGIADALNISPRTVEIHRAHVMEKMEADSLAELVRMVDQLRSFPDENGS